MLFLIMCLLIGGSIGVGLNILHCRRSLYTIPGDYSVFSVVAFLAGGSIGVILSILLAGFTGGAGCGYAEGQVAGYVMEVKKEGSIFKTCEVKLQQGAGEYEQFVKLSGKCLDSYIGERVLLPYETCFLPDFRRGFSGKYIKDK
jgi:hypothetical protein